MRASNGGVTYDAVMDMVFPDLVEMFLAAANLGETYQ